MYTRILLKLSGEQLAGKYEFGVDPEFAALVANEIKQVTDANCEVILVVGGGNMVRGAEIAGNGIRRVTGDQMGMLSGLMNSMALTDIFESQGLPTRCLSNIFATQLAESYSYRLALKHLEQKRVLIVAGGLARPYVTHDTAAVSIGLELDCQAVIKATKVDGVFDSDPATNSEAVKYDTLTFQEAVSNDAIKIMDKAAIGLAMEQHQKIIVFNATKPGNLLRLVQGQPIGTTIG